MAMKMSLKSANEALEAMWELIDRHIKDIALNRRMSEVFMGVSNEQYDERLNEFCEKWHDRFADMDTHELVQFMMNDIVETIAKEAE